MATLRGDIKQRDLEAFEADYNPRIRNEKGELDLNGQQRFYGASVRAAVAAGWFTDLTTQEQVDALTGKEIRKLHNLVHELYGELTELDPN